MINDALNKRGGVRPSSLTRDLLVRNTYNTYLQNNTALSGTEEQQRKASREATSRRAVEEAEAAQEAATRKAAGQKIAAQVAEVEKAKADAANRLREKGYRLMAALRT
jgi:phage regulator Rha-like protein